MSYDIKKRRNASRSASRAESGQRPAKDALTRGRKFSAEDLQAMLLMLLSEHPRHGYELIKAIEMRSNGYYHPSPGVIYPALNQLVEKGYASVIPQGARKQYVLSDSGRQAFAHVKERAELLCARLAHAARKMAWFNEAMNDQQAAVNATGWSPEFVNARRQLREALVLKSGASLEAQALLIPIIVDAAKAIAAVADTPSPCSPSSSFGAHHD
ncbi:MAG: PadR family transcriptional regulator [Pigmentiphaga sp.]|nr:PadR family transcriptional regulator [Pigmentiphaga sp.]